MTTSYPRSTKYINHSEGASGWCCVFRLDRQIYKSYFSTKCPSITMEEFISKLETNLLFAHSIQQRKIAGSNIITFACFHQAHNTTRKDTMVFSKHLFANYEYLPGNIRSDHFLLHRLHDTFCNKYYFLKTLNRTKPISIYVNS